MSRPRPSYRVPAPYATVVAKHRAWLAPHIWDAPALLERAARLEKDYRKWMASKRPPIREHAVGIVNGIRAHRKLARERANDGR